MTSKIDSDPVQEKTSEAQNQEKKEEPYFYKLETGQTLKDMIIFKHYVCLLIQEKGEFFFEIYIQKSNTFHRLSFKEINASIEVFPP